MPGTGAPPHDAGTPSPWLLRWAHLLPAGGTVLDVACGRGRHLRWLAQRGHRATGVDRDAEALAGLAAWAEVVQADIEAGPWPFPGRRFDAVLVTNYLWRPLWPQLLQALAPGGLYLHETFAEGHELLGRPRRSEFLLRRGELLRTCEGLRVVAFEEGALDDPPRVVQRIAALAPGSPSGGGTPPLESRPR
jgi:SAM-dependent methyltransferase